MSKKKAGNQRKELVQVNAWIKPETKTHIKEEAREQGRSYAKQVAFILNQYADCFARPA